MSNAIFLKNNIVEFGSDDKEKSEKNTWCCYEICKDEIIHIAEKKGIEVDKIDFDDVIRYVKKGVSWALDDVWEQIIEESISSSMKKE